MDVNERLRGYKRLDYDGRDCIIVPLEDPLARRIQEEKLCAHQYNPNGFLIVDRDQLAIALKSGEPWRWESPEQKRRRLGHYEVIHVFESSEDIHCDLTLDKLLKEAQN